AAVQVLPDAPFRHPLLHDGRGVALASQQAEAAGCRGCAHCGFPVSKKSHAEADAYVRKIAASRHVRPDATGPPGAPFCMTSRGFGIAAECVIPRRSCQDRVSSIRGSRPTRGPPEPARARLTLA